MTPFFELTFLLYLFTLRSFTHCSPTSAVSIRNDTLSTPNSISFDTNVLRGWNVFNSQHANPMLLSVVAYNNDLGTETFEAEGFENLELNFHCDDKTWSQKAGSVWGQWDAAESESRWSAGSWFKPTKLRYTAKEAFQLGQQSRWRTEGATSLVIRPPDAMALVESEVPIYWIQYKYSGLVWVNGVTGEVFKPTRAHGATQNTTDGSRPTLNFPESS